eukprot:6508919-Pyramimonas_sp.AAC.1
MDGTGRPGAFAWTLHFSSTGPVAKLSCQKSFPRRICEQIRVMFVDVRAPYVFVVGSTGKPMRGQNISAIDPLLE